MYYLPFISPSFFSHGVSSHTSGGTEGRRVSEAGAFQKPKPAAAAKGQPELLVAGAHSLQRTRDTGQVPSGQSGGVSHFLREENEQPPLPKTVFPVEVRTILRTARREHFRPKAEGRGVSLAYRRQPDDHDGLFKYSLVNRIPFVGQCAWTFHLDSQGIFILCGPQ